MLRVIALIISIAFSVVILAGAALSFILAIGSFDEDEIGYALAFTIVLLTISAGWLAGGAGMIFKEINRDFRIVELPTKCPTCGKRTLTAIDIGKNINVIACSSKVCDSFGKAVNLEVTKEKDSGND